MPPLYTRYRPKSLSEVVGQTAVISKLDSVRSSNCDGLAGHAYFLHGPSGTGKTSVAQCIADEVADRYAQVEIDAQRLGLEKVREYDDWCRMAPLGVKQHHCFIVNEVHNATSKVISELQTILESDHVQRTSVWLFTTTKEGQQRLFDTRFDSVPFLSRCVRLEFVRDDLAFARRVWEIANETGLGDCELADYVKLARECGGNMREMLHRVEAGEMKSEMSQIACIAHAL